MTVNERWRICFEFKKMRSTSRSSTIIEDSHDSDCSSRTAAKRELAARNLSANRFTIDLGVPSGRITDILNGRRAISADTAARQLFPQQCTVLARSAEPARHRG
jgi:hypothetical protein